MARHKRREPRVNAGSKSCEEKMVDRIPANSVGKLTRERRQCSIQALKNIASLAGSKKANPGPNSHHVRRKAVNNHAKVVNSHMLLSVKITDMSRTPLQEVNENSRHTEAQKMPESFVSLRKERLRNNQEQKMNVKSKENVLPKSCHTTDKQVNKVFATDSPKRLTVPKRTKKFEKFLTSTPINKKTGFISTFKIAKSEELFETLQQTIEGLPGDSICDKILPAFSEYPLTSTPDPKKLQVKASRIRRKPNPIDNSVDQIAVNALICKSPEGLTADLAVDEQNPVLFSTPPEVPTLAEDNVHEVVQQPVNDLNEHDVLNVSKEGRTYSKWCIKKVEDKCVETMPKKKMKKIKEKEKKKKNPAHQKQFNKWATKMNKSFQDLENYELCIEYE